MNGQVVGCRAQVNPLADKITVLGNILNYHENVYIMMNKPEGVISSTRDNVDITVIDILEGNTPTENFSCGET